MKRPEWLSEEDKSFPPFFCDLENRGGLNIYANKKTTMCGTSVYLKKKNGNDYFRPCEQCRTCRWEHTNAKRLHWYLHRKGLELKSNGLKGFPTIDQETRMKWKEWDDLRYIANEADFLPLDKKQRF